MTYTEFKLYMQAGYIDEMDIDGLRKIEAGNYHEGGMTDEDIELASEAGDDAWQQFAGELADELGELKKQRSSAARALRSIPSKKRSDASRANGAKGGRPRKRVQLINPWSGALPEDKNLTWDEIRAWAQEHVHPDDLPGWLRRARQAFHDNDGAELGAMIIGS